MRFPFSKLLGGLMLCALPALSGCEFLNGDGSPPPSYAIRGIVTGLTGTGLVLQNNGGDDLAVTDDGLFIFPTTLDDGASYEVTVLTQPGSPSQGCVVTNASGVIDMSSVVNVLVTCTSWTDAAKIETDDTGHANTAKLVADSAGSVTAVWTQSDGTRYNLWANRYTLSGGWGTAVKIDSEDLGDVMDFVLVVDDGGFVTVVWNQDDGTRLNQWANRYSGTWGTAVKIDTEDLGHAFEAKLVVDTSGNVTAVWPQADASRNNLWSNRYTFGSGWGTAQKLDSEDLGNAGIPSLIIDGSGNITVVWTQSDGTRNNMWANRYTFGSGWGAAEKIEANDAGAIGAMNASLVIDDSGNVTAIWRQSSATSVDLWSNYYTAGSGWGVAEKVDSEDLGVVEEGESLVVDASGNVTASWRQHDGANYNLWANRYTAGSGWGTAEKIETTDTGDVDPAVLAVDASGNVMAAWRQDDGALYNQWANRYTAGSGWGTAEKIETTDTGDVLDVRLRVDDSGDVTAVWVQRIDFIRYDLWANRYTAGSGWGTAELVETDDTGDVSTAAPELQIDGSGNVIAVWRQFGASYRDIWGNRYVPGSGWSTAVKIDSEELGDVSPTISVILDSAGRTTVAWSQDDGTRYNGWAARLP